VALPVANATTGIALRIIWPRKPSLPALAFDKAAIPLEESDGRASQKGMVMDHDTATPPHEYMKTCESVDHMTSDAATQTDSRYVMTTEKQKQLFKHAYFNMLLF
jgi:hypothetical protein